MTDRNRTLFYYSLMALALVGVGVVQSWSLALTILMYCLVAGVMALGLNVQWGTAGLFNVGLMGFAALGGVSAVLVSMPPVTEAVAAGGSGILSALLSVVVAAALAFAVRRWLAPSTMRTVLVWAVVVLGYAAMRIIADPAVDRIQAVNPSQTGFLGGLGQSIMWSWLVGACAAASVAWVIGKITLGLRSDYLAIATLGISEIIMSVLRYEEWLTRGVKNVNGLPRPLPFEVDLQTSGWVQDLAATLGFGVAEMASIVVKLGYVGLAGSVLLALYVLAQIASYSPWGRMMRAIRDNEHAAAAMGKDVKGRHLQVFVLGSAIVGLAGAMLVTMDGQFTPNSYNPLRYTFLIWVMVIVGGSGNNAGAILGGFVIWFFWVQAEPMGLWFMQMLTSGLADGSALKVHLMDSAAHMRLLVMGLILLLTLRFRPRGLLPERGGSQRH
jgi:branched-chain amino acid transport system permease protein